MKKAVLVLILLFSLSPRAWAAEKYAAIVFDGGPSGASTLQLLEALEQRGAKATFFLCGNRLAQYPDLPGQILAGHHEIGIQGFSQRDMGPMSRRAIARELMDTQALLPEKCHVRFFLPPRETVTDGITQVAKARGLAIILRPEAPGNPVRRTESGDVIIVQEHSGSVLPATEMIDRLRLEGFRFVTLSELARVHNVRIRSGEIYHSFPPSREMKQADADAPA